MQRPISKGSRSIADVFGCVDFKMFGKQDDIHAVFRQFDVPQIVMLPS